MLNKLEPNWNNSTPLYIQLANNLRQLILDGTLPSNDSLPSERKLTEITGASRVTIRKAIDRLVSEGLLLRKQGAGTYIAPPIEQSGEELKSFTEDTLSRGETPTTIWLIRATALPTKEEAKHLHLSVKDQVVRLGRVRLSNGEPLAIEHSVIAATMLPNPEEVTNSSYQALTKNGFPPAKGTQKIQASLATPTEAGLLSIQEGDAILRIERNTFLTDGTPIEYTCSAYRGDKYVFVTELHEYRD